MKELVNIQNKLKAPKSQYNNFAKYSYRNCEDILEALKEHLISNETTLTISDEILMIGDRYYVKATATLTNKEGISVSTTAYARESESKKGMNPSQITGSASSYARKYALNGLFAIDDTKDADTTNSFAENKPKEVKTEDNKKEILKSEIASILKQKNIDFSEFTKYLKANFVTEKLIDLNIKQIENLKKTVASW